MTTLTYWEDTQPGLDRWVLSSYNGGIEIKGLVWFRQVWRGEGGAGGKGKEQRKGRGR